MSLPLDKLRPQIKQGRLLDGEGCPALARDCWPQAQSWTAEELADRAPAAAVLPGSDEEAAAVLAWSSLYGVPVVPRGAGSGVLGAAVPGRSGCVVLDTSLLKERFKLTEDPASPRVRVGAGWLGGELEAKLNALGWSLMNFPASMEISSVGGWVATDSYGQMSTRYGPVSKQVLSVRAVLPGGQFVEEGPEAHVGAEGGLGLITDLRLGVRRLPRMRSFHSLAFRSSEEALAFARRALASASPPSVMRIYSPVDAALSGLLHGSGESHGGLRRRLEPYLLRVRGLIGPALSLLSREWVMVLVYEEEGGVTGEPPAEREGARDLGPGPAERWWKKRYQWSRERLERTFAAGCFADTADLRGSWKVLPELDRAVRDALSAHALAFSHFSHFDAEGGCLYVTFAGAGSRERHKKAWEDAMNAAVEAGGNVNHHHGVGLAKLPWLASCLPAERLRAMSWEKDARDPRGLLNPGKFLEPR